MAEWHLAPDYIIDNWTDELFDLMVEKLIERKKKQVGSSEIDKVSDKELFASAGNLIKVVRPNGN